MVESEKAILEQDKQKEEIGHLNVRSERQMKRIAFDDILYIESLSDYINIHTKSNDKIVSKLKISHIQNELPASFLRIHRSYIINSKEAHSFKSESLLVGTETLPISRSYKASVRAWLSTQALQ